MAASTGGGDLHGREEEFIIIKVIIKCEPDSVKHADVARLEWRGWVGEEPA